MRTTALLATLLALFTATLALQNIRIAKRTSCDRRHLWDYYTYFIDSPPCSEGTRVGSTTAGSICRKDVTILGHQGIRFKGCPASGRSGLPTSVWDGGNPAFGCYNYHDQDIECPNNCPGQSGTHIIRSLSWCSDHDPSGQ